MMDKERARDRLRAIFWIGLFLILILGPLILFIVDRPPAREFWREFAVALGFAGLSLMGIQFIPTARLPSIGDTFPMDTLYYFHHWTSNLSLGLILAHPLILVLNNPNVLRLFDLTSAPWRARAGVIALLALVALVVASIWRQELRIIYEPWHLSHNVLSVAAVGLAFWHIFGVGYHTGVPAQRVLWIAYGVVWAGMAAYARLVKPVMLLSRPYEIVEVTKMRAKAWTVEIAPVDHSGFRFEPGQIAWLTINRSPFMIQEHPFSIASSAERRETYKFTIKELGDFTSRIHECVPGIQVYVDGPYGTFTIDRRPAPGYIFVGGGIGSVPLISMLRTMADRDDQRPVIFFYGNPSWEEVVFRDELEELEKRLNLKLVHVVERPPEEWEGESGFITTEIFDRYLPPDRDEWITFICGPIPMIPFVEHGLQEVGIPRDQIHSERYEMA